MKLAYFALTAAAIAMIGAVGIHGTGRNKDQPLSLQQDTGDFQTAYDRIVERDPAEQMRPVSSDGFSSVPEAQAQQTSPNLRNLSEVSPTQSGNDNNAAPAETDRAPNQPDEPSLKVDESALRYFAQQGDLERLQAEISRLRSLYPNWTPPANPLAVEDGEDDQMNAMWQAYAQGDYAKVNEMIRQRQQEEPDWTPPADLLDRLNLAETRQKLLKAADAGNYQQVIDLASQAPGLLTCSEINILWQVGEAFAKTEKLSRAVDAYSYILKNCDKPEERFATMQKAMQLLPFSDVKTLLTYERTDDAGGPEFQEIRDELLRKRFAEAGADESITVAPEDLDHMETLANTSGDPDDAELLAWYFLQRGSDAAAEEWFRKANAEGGSATTAQGLALILIGQDRASEAENIMYPWRNDSDQAMDTYLNAVVNMLGRIPREEYSDEVLKRMSEVVSETKSMTAAQQFGWYSNDMGQPLAGLQWFEASLSWEPWDEPAAYGVTMMLNRLNYRPGVYQMQKIWAPYSERIAWLYDPNAPVATLDDLKATVFQLTTVKQNNGTSRTVAVPISEIDLATGVETPLGGAMQSTGAPAPSDGAGNMPGVSLTAPLYAPGSNPPPEAAGEEGEPQTVNYVPEYYRYYYGQTGSDDTSAGDEPRVSSLSRAFETLSIPRSMIRTDPATGAQTVTVLNSELQQSRLAYQPSVAQIRAAFYTTGQPSEKTEIYRFDEQAYLNRDYLRQFDINTYAPQQQDAGAGDQVSLSTLPAGTPLPQGDPVAASSTATARSSTSSSKSSSAGKTTSGGGASSSGSCWSGRSPEGLSPAAAVQQAWCLMDLERPMEAAKAFEVGLGSGSSKVREEAAYGQSLAYMRMGLNSKAAVSASQAPLNRERQLDVQIQLLTNRALAAYQGGHYNDALMLLSQRDQLAPLEAGLMVIRGYSYYNLKRYFDARQVFEALAEMGNRDGMEGLSLVNQALGLETQ